MTAAKSLKDLLRIREANRDLIENLEGNLGSALGFKYANGEQTDIPAVLIFVQRKIHETWLSPKQVIPRELQGPDGLVCPTDVVQGGTDERLVRVYPAGLKYLNKSSGWAFSNLKPWGAVSTQPAPPHPLYKQNDAVLANPFIELHYPEDKPDPQQGIGTFVSHLERWSNLVDPPPLSAENVQVLEVLHGSTDKMYAGSVLYHPEGWLGTAGCFVRDRASQNLGILTNQHVAGNPGDELYFPWANAEKAGQVVRVFETVPAAAKFPGVRRAVVDEYSVDCAYVELTGDMKDKVNFELYKVGQIGVPLPLDLETMGPIGQRVTSVGSTRGVQNGTIAAFAYEWLDKGPGSCYTDYLIIGDEVLTRNGIAIVPTAFSDHGDSGKIVVTDDQDHRPIALLWGGGRMRLRPGRMQEKWTLAIDINKVLDLLEVNIAS